MKPTNKEKYNMGNTKMKSENKRKWKKGIKKKTLMRPIKGKWKKESKKQQKTKTG